jgi:hypothetical protein
LADDLCHGSEDLLSLAADLCPWSGDLPSRAASVGSMSKVVFLSTKGLLLESKALFLSTRGILLESKAVWLESKALRLESKALFVEPEHLLRNRTVHSRTTKLSELKNSFEPTDDQLIGLSLRGEEHAEDMVMSKALSRSARRVSYGETPIRRRRRGTR